MSPTIEELKTWRGKDLVGVGDDKLGTIDDVYVDEQTGRPEWVAVSTGLFGRKISFVPITEAQQHNGHVHVPYEKEQVKDAPHAEPDGALSQDEEARLYRHYGMSYGEARSDSGLPDATGRDTSGPTTDDAMTRSEEELRVGTADRERGRARLRKYVVTEDVQTTVPVRREEARIEREPITDANVDQALDGPAISEEEHEVVLHEEEPVVEKRAVPKERVRLEKDAVVDERTVKDEVRKEVIDREDDAR